MTNIYAINLTSSGMDMTRVPIEHELPTGYSSLVTLKGENANILYAYNKESKLFDVYQLDMDAPHIKPIITDNDGFGHYAFDQLRSFVMGNKSYLMAYEKHRGHFQFFEVLSDYTLSAPYGFMNQRSWPTQNFSHVEPFVITGLMYILGYDDEHGTVAIFSLDVISTSKSGIPPFNMLNVWYHQWARGWENFSFFQLGQSNFFFKINKMKLNVNIDHILDSPAEGSVEIGSYLQNQLPNALDVSLACIIPWQNGEPYLATYDGKSNATNLYQIHSDCQGWTHLHENTVPASTIMNAYRIDNQSFLLLYA